MKLVFSPLIHSIYFAHKIAKFDFFRREKVCFFCFLLNSISSMLFFLLIQLQWCFAWWFSMWIIIWMDFRWKAPSPRIFTFPSAVLIEYQTFLWNLSVTVTTKRWFRNENLSMINGYISICQWQTQKGGEKIKFSTRVNKVNQFLEASSSSINFYWFMYWGKKFSNVYNHISLANFESVFLRGIEGGFAQGKVKIFNFLFMMTKLV